MNEIEQLTNSTLDKKKLTISKTGKFLIGITGGIGIGVSIICFPFVSPALRKYCLPYVPATERQIENVISMIPKHTRNKILDIGSGDGRIIISTLKKCENCVKYSHGVELNPWLVYYSRLSALKNGVFNQSKFYHKDLWKFDTSPYNCVIIFGVEQMMNDIEMKLKNELKPKTKIIACRFPLPTLHPIRTIECGVDTVWTYEIK